MEMIKGNPYHGAKKNLTDNKVDCVSDAPLIEQNINKLNSNQAVVTQSKVVTVNRSAPVPPNIPISHNPVGPDSALMTCPHCRCRIQTRISHRTTAKTHIACLLLTWTCCCCCLPYCMDTCRNTNHYCPQCNAYLGTYAS